MEFEPTDGSIVCWLISEDLAEIEIDLAKELMGATVERLTKLGYAIINQ